MTSSSPPVFFGTYYDGRTAKAHAVRCTIEDGQVHVEGDGIARADAVGSVTLSDQLGSAPRKLSFSDGACVEAPLSPELLSALGRARGSASWVARLEMRWHYAVLALVLSVAMLAAGYYWGLPAAASLVAQRLPADVIDSLGKQTIKMLDAQVMRPSKSDATRRQGLQDGVQQLSAGAGALPRHTLLFRDGGAVGANALALPDGSVIVTDQLMALTQDDDEVLAVIAHELGHLHHRHALRGLIQGSIVAGLMAWYVGDFSSLAAGLPALLMQTGYSRQFEREADLYGARLLRANGRSPALLASMLEKLESAHGSAGAPDYLSTHPATAERAAALRDFRE